MATLDTLAICGIRSFGHESEDKQIIKFEKPLTLIMGENGCGKSTIIESLRYVTAQKEPIGRGVFVRDPQHTQQSTVKGFIKLKLFDRKGLQVHLSRALQVTRTAKTLTAKQLDSTFTREDPKTRELKSISSRCSDFSPETLRIFGVSKAILENVIFCTQEDTMWPLDTDQKLKEKFDQIFDSDKYNKCAKKIRDRRKQYLDAKKKFETEIKYLEENKVAAATKRDQVERLENEVCQLKAQIEEIDRALVPIRLSLVNIRAKEMELSKVYTTCETKKTELDGITKIEDELKIKIQRAGCEFTGSDESLEKALTDCVQKAQNTSALRAELNAANEREQKISKEIRMGAGEVGELKKLTEINNQKITEKCRYIQSLADILCIETPNPTEITLEQKVNEKENSLKDLRQLLEHDEDVKQALIDKATEKLFSEEAVVKQKQDALDENKKEIRKIKKEMEDIEASQARLDRVAASLRKATSDLDEHQRIFNAEQLKTDITHWQTEVSRLEDALTEVENDAHLLQQQTSLSLELEHLKGSLAEKAAEAHRLRQRHEDTLQEVLGTVPDSGLCRAVEIHVEAKSRHFRQTQSQQTSKEKDISALEERRRQLKSSIRNKQQNVQQLSDRVLQETGGDDWERSVKEQQRSVDELLDTKGTLASSSCMFQRYIRALQRPKPCCPLCNRDFTAEQEARQLAEELADKVRDVPNRIRENQRDLDEKQEKLNKLLALQSIQDRIAELKVEIPNLEKEVVSVEETLVRYRRELDELVIQKQKSEKDINTCSGMLSDLALHDKASSEARKLESEIEKLQTRFPPGVPQKSLQEVLAKQDKLRQESRIARRKQQESQSQLQKSNDTLLALQTNKHRLAEEKRKLEGEGGSRKTLEDRWSDLQGLEAVLMAEVQAAKEAVYPLVQDRLFLINDLKELKVKHKLDIEEKRKELDTIREQLSNILRLRNEISSFERKGYGKKLTDIELNLAKLEEDAKAVKNQKETVSSKIGDLSKVEVRRRELEDNKALRLKTKEKTRLEVELRELEANVGDAGFDEIVRERSKLKKEEESKDQAKANARGRIGALTAQVDLINQELKGKLYVNVEKEYKRTLIEKTVSDSVAEDLLRYATCMEWAMSQYHKKQMESVNSFAREYWRMTYQGNDIDFIEILTQETVTVSDKRRNYTYRLVLAKGDVRMEMRNHCSAGQKMLASLVIRMALAEVFSNNCGILTLDEPTTNLDRKNVRNLARLLSEVVTAKQRALHSNFQLIVITHDDDFVKELVNIHDIQTCIKVWRDHSGKSKASLQRVHNISRDMDVAQMQE